MLHQTQLPRGFHLFPAAERVIDEFAGLTFKESTFWTRIDPNTASEFVDNLRGYEASLGHPLYPIAAINGGDSLCVVIEDRGYLYTITDRLEPFASCFDQAIKYLVRICAYRKVEYQRDLESVGLFGKHWEVRSTEPE